MAKKKGKKKDLKKKKVKEKEKKKKKRVVKKKDLKKKETKKKDSKKNKKKKKAAEKLIATKITSPKKSIVSDTPASEVKESASFKSGVNDRSLNYNVREANKILRTFKSPEEVNNFSKGETRLTVKRVVQAVLRHFEN